MWSQFCDIFKWTIQNYQIRHVSSSILSMLTTCLVYCSTNMIDSMNCYLIKLFSSVFIAASRTVDWSANCCVITLNNHKYWRSASCRFPSPDSSDCSLFLCWKMSKQTSNPSRDVGCFNSCCCWSYVVCPYSCSRVVDLIAICAQKCCIFWPRICGDSRRLGDM